jgi:hypothetical protein
VSKRFSAEQVERARAIPLADTVQILGFYSKPDSAFKPIKDGDTQRWHVSVGASVIEMLVTGEKWFVPAEERGGGGAIDLAKYLGKLDFVQAVKLLIRAT